MSIHISQLTHHLVDRATDNTRRMKVARMALAAQRPLKPITISVSLSIEVMRANKPLPEDQQSMKLHRELLL